MIKGIPHFLSLQAIDPESYEAFGLIKIDEDQAQAMFDSGVAQSLYDGDGEPFAVYELQPTDGEE